MIQKEAQQHVIRPVRADEWEKVKEIRLASLADPVAHIAFLDTHEAASARPDSFWQERTEGAASGNVVRQFVAEDAAGVWGGSVSVLVERAGSDSVLEDPIEQNQAHLVGVYVRPEHRGTGLIEALFSAAVEWAWSLREPELERVRLFVHEENARAAAFYRRFGFAATGKTVPVPGTTGAREVEYALSRA
ncbi:GNAT family N-acetyltransferase [Streptomyces sp. NPDC086023]|uniref:GNAT family N-acetyltransferase n=1 Tax=Streptomyces sp. NPDC086023 TaxID=3365746 RepID=UPI0037CD42A1